MKAFDEITEEDFAAYEQVRAIGSWNMFDPNAQIDSGLDRKTFVSVLHHYGKLRRKYSQLRPSLVLAVINDEL